MWKKCIVMSFECNSIHQFIYFNAVIILNFIKMNKI